VGTIDKDEATVGEQQIRRYSVDTDPVSCLDYGFTTVQVRVTHSDTSPLVLFVVRGDMLFRGIMVFGVPTFTRSVHFTGVMWSRMGYDTSIVPSFGNKKPVPEQVRAALHCPASC